MKLRVWNFEPEKSWSAVSSLMGYSGAVFKNSNAKASMDSGYLAHGVVEKKRDY